METCELILMTTRKCWHVPIFCVTRDKVSEVLLLIICFKNNAFNLVNRV